MEGEVAPDRLRAAARRHAQGRDPPLAAQRRRDRRMDEPAPPALILFPRFGGLERAVAPVGQAEVFVRLTQASTNYVTLGDAASTR